jgi:hypothetical protein
MVFGSIDSGPMVRQNTMVARVCRGGGGQEAGREDSTGDQVLLSKTLPVTSFL